MENYQKWVKEMKLSDYLPFDSFEINQRFKMMGEIVLDDEKKENGEKQRKTMWKVNIPEDMEGEYKRRQNCVYILVCNGKIIKIGGTKTGMKERIVSYYCGHYITGMKKKNGDVCEGKMSITNAYIYWTIYENLRQGNTFNVYVYAIPDEIIEMDIFNTRVNVPVQTYDAYEAAVLNMYRSTMGHYPVLSDNGHPD